MQIKIGHLVRCKARDLVMTVYWVPEDPIVSPHVACVWMEHGVQKRAYFDLKILEIVHADTSPHLARAAIRRR
jgi:hypothetical protein